MKLNRLTRILLGALLFFTLYPLPFTLFSPFTSTNAYAASKDNPPVAFAQYSSSGQESVSWEQSREVLSNILRAIMGVYQVSEVEKFSTRLTCIVNMSARTVLDDMMLTSARTVLQYTSSLSRSISDWLCPSAYAASKGNPPVAYWRFDEGGGPTAYDGSGNGNNGTLNAGAGGTNTAVGQMWTRQGKISSALELDGTDDYFELASAKAQAIFGGKTTITVSFWIKPLASGTGLHFLEYGIGASTFSLEGSTASALFYVNNGSSTAVALDVNQWQYISLVLDGTNKYIYKNGIVASSIGFTAAILNSASAFDIGGRGATRNSNILVDDFTIYNYARTATQIMVDYNAGSAAYLGAGADPNEGNPPVGYWKFDENTGTTAYDRSGNGNNGTLINGPTWAQGKYGTALSFDGSNDYVVTPSSNVFAFPGDFTMSGWFYLPQLPSPYGVCKSTATSGGLAAVIGPNRFSFGRSLVAEDAIVYYTPPVNRWFNLAIVRSGTTGYFYLDGTLIGSAASTTSYPAGNTIIGIDGNYVSFPFNGRIDDFKIYNYARTPGQIAYDYNKGKPVAQYRFDEGGGTIAHNDYSSADSGVAPVGWWRMDNNWNDASGNGINGTASNATFDSASKIGSYCGSFNGTTSYVNFSVPTPSLPITIEMWANPATATPVGMFDSASGQPNVFRNYPSGYVEWWPSTPQVALNLSASTWQHLVFVFRHDGTNRIIDYYKNGVLQTTASAAGSSTFAWTTFTLGNINGGGAGWYGGLIDDVRIYNYARTAEQIYNDYKTTHGTLVGDTKFVDGKIGKALSFDGAGDYVVVPNSSTSQIFTTSFWFYTSTPAANMYLLDRGVNIHWFELYNSKLRSGTSAANYSDSTTTLQANTWYHAAMTYDGTTIKQYLNGVQQFSIAGGNVTPSGLDIGRVYGAATYFNGKLDDIRIYNYSRTAEQVMQDYNEGKSVRLGAQAVGVADPWGGALPVGHWKMDENTGVLAYDASGNGNDGTLTNMEASDWVNGKDGLALQFDGTNEYVGCGNNAVLNFTTGDFTIEARIKTSFGSGQTIVQRGLSQVDGYTLMADPYVHLLTHQAGAYTYVRSQNTVNIGQWQHLAAVRQGTNARLYLNGVESIPYTGGTPTSIANAVTSTRAFEIGKGSWGYFNGQIDDVKIYNYARTQAQITWDYNRGKPVGYWRFDEGSGTTAYDDSDNNNDGTITIGATGTQTTIASAWTNGATGKFGKCMSFDGTDDYVQVNDSTSLRPSQVSVEVWFKSSDTTKSIVAKPYATNSWSYGFHQDGNLKAIFNFGTQIAYDSGYAIPLNTWVHAVATYDSAYVRIYVNGVLKNETAQTGSISYDASPLRIGSHSATYPQIFNGLIDDVRIYNYARTAEQITQDYNQGLAAKLGE